MEDDGKKFGLAGLPLSPIIFIIFNAASYRLSGQ
jgi:hypothetical protein